MAGSITGATGASHDPWPVLEIEPVKTAHATVDRLAIDRVEDLSPTAVPHRTPTDPFLEAESSRDSVVSIIGLGDLPADAAGLEHRVARLVRAQGIEAVRIRLASAKASAEQLGGMGRRFGGADNVERAKTIAARIDQMTVAVATLEAERTTVREALMPHARRQADKMLDAAARRVAGMRAQYQDIDQLRSLRSSARSLIAALGRASRTIAEATHDSERQHARATYAATHRRIAEAHPILARFELGVSSIDLMDIACDSETRLVAGHAVETPRPLDTPTRAMLDAADAAIADMRERLVHDPAAVWKLPTVVDATLIAHGVPADGMVAAHARDIVRTTHRDERLWQTFMSIASVTLGVAAALPSGGTSLGLSAGAAASIDAYQLYLSVEAYRFTADTWAAELSNQRPTPIGVLIDGLGAAAGFSGGLTAAAKTAFVRRIAHTDSIGDAARGLEMRLGRDSAAALFAKVGENEAAELYASVAPEVWSALALIDDGAAARALDVLGTERFVEWAQVMGATGFASAVRRVEPAVWPHLLSTPIEPADLVAALALGDGLVTELAPLLKGRGLAELSRAVDGAPVASVGGGFVTVHGHLRFHANQVTMKAKAGTLDVMARRWSALEAKAPEVTMIAQVTERDLDDLTEFVKQTSADKPIHDKQLQRIADRIGHPARDVRRLVRNAAGFRFSARAAALEKLAPELADGLAALESSRIAEALRDRALALLEDALDAKGATIARGHLGAWLEDAVHAGRGLDQGMAPRLEELAFAVEVVEGGRAAKDSTVYLGIRSGESVVLAPGGARLELPAVDPNMKGTLQDLDVVFLDKDGVVQVVEVKRSDEALWHALENSDRGRYLYKFVQLRAQRSDLDAALEIRFGLRQSETGALDRMVTKAQDTPRSLLTKYKIHLEVSP